MISSPRARRHGLAALFAAISLFASFSLLTPSEVLAQGASVRYSYQKVSLNGAEQWVLVPVADTKLAVKGKSPSKSDVIKAFNALKNDKKRYVYGDTDIRIGSGRWPDGARVQVTVDPKFAKYAQVIIAEVVYTLTEMGLNGVEFPGHADGAIAREDVPFVVYTLTIPMWQAITMQGTEPAQILLPNGETLWAKDFYERWKRKDDALIQGLYSYLKSPNRDTTVYVLRKLPSLEIPYVAQVTPLLSHDSSVVRREALTVLRDERDEESVLAAVSKALTNEKDAATAAEMATFLGASKKKNYAVLDPMWRLGQGEDTKARTKAAADLATYSGDARATELLSGALDDKDANVAKAAAQSLAKMNESEAQIKALKNAKIAQDLRLAIAKDLSKDKKETAAITGLTYLATNAPEREAIRAVEGLAARSNDETARRVAEGFLTDKTTWRRRAASEALASQKNPATLSAFAKAIRDVDEDRALEEDGYAVMVAQPLDTILGYTRDRDNVVQRLAYRAVGERAVEEKAGRKVIDTLKTGASNRDPMIRGASARALGSFANKEAEGVLKTMRADKSAQVRRDVALALGEFKDDVMLDVLVAYLDDKDPEVIAAAVDSLGARKEAGSWDRIKGYTSSKEPSIRAAALRALARLTNPEDKQTVTEVVSILSGAVNDKNEQVRTRAIEQLGTFNSGTAVMSIASQLESSEVDMQVAAIRALGTTKNSEATRLITNKLDAKEPKIRRAAALALADLGDKGAKDELKAQISKEKDDELKDLMQQTLRKL